MSVVPLLQDHIFCNEKVAL